MTDKEQEEQDEEDTNACPLEVKAMEVAIAFFGFGYGSDILLAKVVQLINVLPEQLKQDAFVEGRKLAEEERLRRSICQN